jgi:hypothetical protein
MRFAIATSVSLLMLTAGCKGIDQEPFDAENGLLGDGIGEPFPNAHQVGEDGKLALDSSQFPLGPDPFPADLANYRTGFSPIQVATLDLPGLSCGDCPKWKKAIPGEGSVLLIDLTDGVFMPVMAELDAHEDAVEPTLIVRPLAPIPYGHDAAIVLTTSVMERPARFDKLITGVFDSPWSDHYRGVVDAAVALGVNEDQIALAWDFPVGDGTQITRSAAAQATPTGDYVLDFIKDEDNPDDLMPDSMLRMAQGRFDTPGFITSDQWLDVDMATGDVAPTGTISASLVIAVPDGARTADLHSMPVLVYGPGIFSSPEVDVFGATNDWVLTDIATELGVVIIATEWGGLDADGWLTAAAVANNLSDFPVLASQMIQGQANHQALLRLIRDTDLRDDPIFFNDSGESVLDTSHVYFYGVSMGGILGGVFAAQEDSSIEASVFHVGGAGWSTLLERTSLWTQFEMFVLTAVANPADRQGLYAAAQLFWDPVDPAAYSADLQDELILLQEAKNDDTVSNICSRLAARTYGLPLLDPSVDMLDGFEMVQADLPAGSRAFVQFDPEKTAPANENRPAQNNGAHTWTMGWWESYQQSIDFLTPGQEGTVNHYCGTEACSASNRG